VVASDEDFFGGFQCIQPVDLGIDRVDFFLQTDSERWVLRVRGDSATITKVTDGDDGLWLEVLGNVEDKIPSPFIVEGDVCVGDNQQRRKIVARSQKSSLVRAGLSR
jgi:hypothetical protein